MTEYLGTGTYSPEDDKLRMYPFARLDLEDYKRMKALGFSWAPKQELFFAIWSPKREDLILEFCGEIEDEDKSLVERAEERAERFETYSEKRENEANQVKDAVKALADNIPFGQPILVGHHSEKRARKDAERIQNGMSKAVKLWETSKYWSDRAAGALHHAKYKELPIVRARRIKKIEAEIRQMIASYTPKNPNQILNQEPWHCPTCKKSFCKEHLEAKQPVPHVFCGQARGGSWVPVSSLEGIKKYYARSIAHCENRLIYEKAMLNEQGQSHLIEKKARPKQLPLVNYKRPEGYTVVNPSYYAIKETFYKYIEMTSEQYKNIAADMKRTVTIDNSHRMRATLLHIEGKPYYMVDYAIVFLTDSKTHEKPAPIEIQPKVKAMPDTREPYIKPDRTEFDDLKDSLKAGVQVVSAPQLFPTPAEIADLMIKYADIQPGHDVLEPSAGTGNLLKVIPCVRPNGSVTAVEINYTLAQGQVIKDYADQIFNEDFLTCNGNLGKFDRILMNPPFENGSDIKHIKHAMTFLKPGGRLVALCANGPRQNEQLQPLADHWEVLPEGSFKQAGTNVNVALLVINN